MGSFFAKRRRSAPPPGQAISSRDKAVYDLKVQRDRLRKFVARQDAQVERETHTARDLLAQGRRDRARLVLRRRKYLQTAVGGALAKLANVEDIVNSIQFAEMTAQVFAALKEGSEMLQHINAQMDIEDVEKLMDDSAEAISYQNQISELLGQQLSPDDDRTAELELERLEQEEATAELAALPSVPITAAAPAEAARGEIDSKQRAVLID